MGGRASDAGPARYFLRPAEEPCPAVELAEECAFRPFCAEILPLVPPPLIFFLLGSWNLFLGTEREEDFGAMLVIEFPVAGPRSLDVDFLEVLFHGEVVADRILPPRVTRAIEGKVLLHPNIYIADSEPLHGRRIYGKRGETRVRAGGAVRNIVAALGFWFCRGWERQRRG